MGNEGRQGEQGGGTREQEKKRFWVEESLSLSSLSHHLTPLSLRLFLFCLFLFLPLSVSFEPTKRRDRGNVTVSADNVDSVDSDVSINVDNVGR